MFSKSIGKMVVKTSAICARFDAITFNSIRKVLPDRVILAACKDSGHHYRCRLISPVLTILHMVVAALWPEESFNAGWQLLWSAFTSNYPSLAGSCPSRATVAKARKRLTFAVWKKVTSWICQQSQRYSECLDTWRGHRVVLVDGTCLTLPDEPQLHENFPPPNGNHGYGRYPLVRLVCLSLAQTMTVINYRIGRYRQDENDLLKPMLKMLRKGDLLVADRHFAGANLYWTYMSNGLEYLTRAHQKLKIARLKPLRNHSKNDFVTNLKIGESYRRKNPQLPESIAVRCICAAVCVRGKRKDIWLVTSLLDTIQYPAEEIAERYLQRWRIETLLRQFKVDTGSDQLRSKSVAAIRKEIAARICAVNIVRMIILEAAKENNVDPLRISFVSSIRIIIAYAPALGLRPPEQLPMIYHAMLKEIASHLVPQRMGRIEPRGITHEPKHYPRLSMTRQQWRKLYAA